MPDKMQAWEIERHISEMVEIEDFLYNEIQSQWTTPLDLSYKLCHAEPKIYINDMGIVGSQAWEITTYILEYYKIIQEHYKNPNFKDMLDPIQKHFPDRSEFQIAVVEDIHNPGKLRIRKRLFRRIMDRI